MYSQPIHLSLELILCIQVTRRKVHFNGDSLFTYFLKIGYERYVKCALVVSSRKTYVEAKSYCSNISLTFSGKTMFAQMKDLSGNFYYYVQSKT